MNGHRWLNWWKAKLKPKKPVRKCEVLVKTIFLRSLWLLFVLFLLVACAFPIFTASQTPRPTIDETITPSKTVTPFSQNVSQTPDEGNLPDLAYYYYSILYDDCPWGGPGSITVRVNNLGSADAGGFDVVINGLITHVDGIPAGESADAVVHFDSGPIGHVEIQIDPHNLIPENDKENNLFAIVFTPPPPCLTETP
jgi:hypothetical protein